MTATELDDGAPAHAAPSPRRWWVLALCSATIAGCYYEYDAIAPIADLLRAQRDFSQTQIGMLNAVFSLPNIVLALVGGLLIDRYGSARVAFWSAGLCFVGALLTAVGNPYSLMVLGRLIFGVSDEALFIALLAGLAQWFAAGGTAFAMALFFSLARVGSYAADTSPGWAKALYAHGWQPPLWFGAAIVGAGLIAAAAYRFGFPRPGAAPRAAGERIDWADVWRFDRSFWFILTLNVLFASVFFPFRST
ncbi:MAG TPA: MFS transporter, partial [Steroidobacteraceae bacterium]|nr:MFS transporter [Steroidobacteraceae bacterium]